jgi:hypothetical protein
MFFFFNFVHMLYNQSSENSLKKNDLAKFGNKLDMKL